MTATPIATPLNVRLWAEWSEANRRARADAYDGHGQRGQRVRWVLELSQLGWTVGRIARATGYTRHTVAVDRLALARAGVDWVSTTPVGSAAAGTGPTGLHRVAA